ncbi:MAG: multidrug transporter subunit MdtA [Methylobacter sp.]|nr:MAG: multidrug transporter subunit MdtA [Methylobacter sp.]
MKPETVESIESQPGTGKRRLIPVILILAAISAIWLLKPYLMQSDGAKTPEAQSQKPGPGGNGGFRKGGGPVAVTVKPVIQGDMPVYLSALGTVTGVTAVIKPRVDGELLRVGFKEGSKVNAGDVLAQIDPRPFEVQLMQAEGQLMRDEALLNNAKLDLQRYDTLLEQDSIAAQQTATQESLVKQYQGTVTTDRALVANAQLQLSYTKITAPISGRVGLRAVDPGNIVKATDAAGIAVITQTQPITVVFTLPEDQLQQVIKYAKNASLPVEVYDRSGKNQLAVGYLLAIDNQIDINTGTVKLKAQFGNEDNTLFSNQFVNVKLKVDTLRNAAMVPDTAIQTGASGTFVFSVKDDQTVAVNPVKLGPGNGESVVVLSGIEPGAMVVIDGADKLRDGAQVKLLDKQAPEASQPPPAGDGEKARRDKWRKRNGGQTP